MVHGQSGAALVGYPDDINAVSVAGRSGSVDRQATRRHESPKSAITLSSPPSSSNVVCQGCELRNRAAFDRRDPLLRYPHGLGDLDLGHSRLLPHFGQVLAPDLERALLPRLLHSRAVVRVDELVDELIAGIGEELGLLAHRCSFRYASYAASAAGIACAYHSCHRPDLSPATCLVIASLRGTASSRQGSYTTILLSHLLGGVVSGQPVKRRDSTLPRAIPDPFRPWSAPPAHGRTACRFCAGRACRGGLAAWSRG